MLSFWFWVGSDWREFAGEVLVCAHPLVQPQDCQLVLCEKPDFVGLFALHFVEF
jgi:hypothetical protein